MNECSVSIVRLSSNLGRPGGFGCSESNFTPMEMIVMAFNDLKSGGLTGWYQSGRGI